MGTSGCAYLSYNKNLSQVEILCTDEKMIDLVCIEIQKLFPNSKINWHQLISGENYRCFIHKLPKDTNVDVMFWILKQFCLKGWEPFEVNGSFSFFADTTVCLRLNKDK